MSGDVSCPHDEVPCCHGEVDALADEIAVAAATMDSAMHGMLVLIRRFDQQKGWARQGRQFFCGDTRSPGVRSLAELAHQQSGAVTAAELVVADLERCQRGAPPSRVLLPLGPPPHRKAERSIAHDAAYWWRRNVARERLPTRAAKITLYGTGEGPRGAARGLR